MFSRARQWIREARRLPRADWALAGALAVLGELDALFGDWRGPTAVNAVVVPVMALALAWRRRNPLGMLAVVIGLLVALSLAFGGSETSTAVFITVAAVYSAGVHARSFGAVVALTALGAAVATLRDPLVASFGDAAWSPLLLGLTLGVAYGMRTRSNALDREAEALESEQAQRTAAAAEEERRRIARELHDIISHSLGVLVLQAGAAEQVLERDPERARLVLRSIRTTGQEAIGEMSTLLGLIRSDAVVSREPQPSLDDLDRLVARTREAGLAVELAIEGEPRPLPAALELSAYRIVQEGLTNALKHAGPAHAVVRLRYGAEDLEVEVTDDGTQTANGRGSRRGLAGIGERVAVFGGRFEAGPGLDGGWSLRATFPTAR